MEKIVGKVLYILKPISGLFFEDIEWTIFKILKDDGNTHLCLGNSFSISKGFRVELEGEYCNGKDSNEKIFKFCNIKKCFDTPNSYKTFLMSICGNQSSKLLIDYFGSAKEVLRIIKNEPNRLNDVKGIGKKRIDKILVNYSNSFKIENIFSQLKEYGFDLQECSIIAKKIGSKNINKIFENPYFLMFNANFSFIKCDEIALRKANISYDSPKRLQAVILEIMRLNNKNANTFIYKKDLLEKSIALSRTKNQIVERSKILSVYSNMIKNSTLYEVDERVYTKKSYFEEKDIRDFLLASLKLPLNRKVTIDDIRAYEKSKGFSLGEEQINAVLTSASNKLSVITGGPGTGKTTVLDCLLTIIRKSVPSNKIALCSPTAKAARRMTESTGMPATTVHKLLEVNPEDSTLETFNYNQNNKLPYEVIVVDESSMLDQFIACSLIRALKSVSQVIFVGDKNQLPPVKAGYFFRDLMELKIPCTHLIKTYRQAGDSTIIKLAQEIQKGEISPLKAKNDFGFKSVSNCDEVVDIFLRGVKQVGVEQVVVLSPQNKGELGTKEISNAILNKLIPSSDKEIHKNGWIFREGARIMNTKNMNQLGLCNGQMGYIKKIDFEEKKLIVEFDGKEYEYDNDMANYLVLGYCVTIHKSQGSEWKYVIEVVSQKHPMNTKPLVYTGITRAKSKLAVVGDLETFMKCPLKMPKEVLSRI